MSEAKQWTQKEALELCEIVEVLCPQAGCHVALTGGLLYKQGPRKDCDLLFYRIRQVERIDMDRLWALLEKVGLRKISGRGWCYKAQWNGKAVDIFFPEEELGEYNPERTEP